ncbi:MAG: NAD(P)-binding domain-containing protein [Planctomycetota bacterium]|nr:NAD(P)-binding domain-containing protein [Planctomycetota bacterium]
MIDVSGERNAEVVVIGAGPIGLETAIELGRAGIDALVVDAGAIGQQILDFPPATRWFSSPERLGIGGIPFTTPAGEKGTREQYLAYLRSVVDAFGLEVATYQRVFSIQASSVGRGFELETRSRSGLIHRIRAATLVMATGGTARPRSLGIPGEDLPHVHRSLGEPHCFHGRRLLVVGGKNSACDAAVLAYRCGARVTLCHRGQGIHERVKYWIRPELEAMLRSGQIIGRFMVEPVEITPREVVVRSTADGVEERIAADDVLLAIGFESDQSLFSSLGVALSADGEAVEHDPQTMRTNVPGVYVAGTATAGTQSRFKVYIENSHIHARRIAAALSGIDPPAEPAYNELPES